jgi:septal ring factor EnvC (AmiA/AmiB activator)
MSENPHAYQALAAALRERLAVIADRESYARDAAAHLDRLKAASEKIGALQGQLPAPVNPQLAHYLERSSFDKALEFLETH